MKKKLVFIKKERIKTQSKKKDVVLIFKLQETKDFNLFDKSCAPENFNCQIQHGKVQSLLNLSITSNTTFR